MKESYNNSMNIGNNPLFSTSNINLSSYFQSKSSTQLHSNFLIIPANTKVWSKLILDKRSILNILFSDLILNDFIIQNSLQIKKA